MQETEAKFYVQDLQRSRVELEELGATLLQARVLERNIRFDLPDHSLRAGRRVLRLRYDTAARLTYKGASDLIDGIMSREEIEFVVEDFDKAKHLLEALGYQKWLYYEKYRTIYELDGLHVMLDELPFGNFIEIEGETVELIHTLTDKLHLSWETATGTSYNVLFERVCTALHLSFHDISFADFAGIKVSPADLEVHAADSQLQ